MYHSRQKIWEGSEIASSHGNVFKKNHEINATIILTRRKLTRSEINANDQLCLLRVS